jgi:uncharacterized membrane protein YidH (DUF202 family)
MAEGERGLQRERTALAWDRTGVSFLIASALLVRVVGPPYPNLRHLPAALGLLLGALLVSGAVGREHVPPGSAQEHLRVRPWAMRLLAAAAVAFGAVSLAALLA